MFGSFRMPLAPSPRVFLKQLFKKNEITEKFFFADYIHLYCRLCVKM